MSELDKLKFKWQKEHSRRIIEHLCQYYEAVDKLQKECKHNRTHWMQELDKQGNIKEGLVKRCLICGSNIQKVEGTKEEIIEEALHAFDMIIENRLNQSDLSKGEKHE